MNHPFFILGSQRSGTSMLVDVLDKSDAVRAYEESDPAVIQGDYRLRSKSEIDALVAASTKPAVVFKPLADSHYADDILRRHPGSKGLWLYRRYTDVANSSVRKWPGFFREILRNFHTRDLSWLGWRGERLSEADLDFLAGFWHDDVTDHEAAALFWWLRNRTFFDRDLASHPDLVLLVQYEHLVQRPHAAFARVCAFMDVPFEESLVAEVSARSVGKSAFPPIDARIRELCDGLLERLDEAFESARQRPMNR